MNIYVNVHYLFLSAESLFILSYLFKELLVLFRVLKFLCLGFNFSLFLDENILLKKLFGLFKGMFKT